MSAEDPRRGTPPIRALAANEAALVRASCALPRISAIVEELVCNALDAGSTDIVVSLDVPRLSCTCRDNGCGMTQTELAMVGQRHATSKLASIRDLHRGVSTLGFRGEALYALASISQLEIMSTSSSTPSSTHSVVLQLGHRSAVAPSRQPRSVGTTVSARNCFANRSIARRQLERPGATLAETELARKRLAALSIAHPSVAFRLHDAQRNLTLLHAPRASDELARLKQHLGGIDLPQLTGVRASDSGYGLEGWVAVPPAAHRSRDCQYVFLNRRPLSRKAELHRLVEQMFPAVPGATADMPAFILFVQCSPSQFDLTLEPDKSDAIFTDGGIAVAAFVGAALRDLFDGHRAEGRCRGANSSATAVKAADVAHTYAPTALLSSTVSLAVSSDVRSNRRIVATKRVISRGASSGDPSLSLSAAPSALSQLSARAAANVSHEVLHQLVARGQFERKFIVGARGIHTFTDPRTEPTGPSLPSFIVCSCMCACAQPWPTT